MAAPALVIPAKSIAVLPFVNESGDKDQQYFSDGLSEDLITALSQFAGLKVISRNSAFRFRNSTGSSAEIGMQLGVAHLLEGSVRRAGDQVRISASLVKASDGSTLWSQHYDRPYKDLFALQDAITQAVADALKAELLTAPGAVLQSDRPPSGNLAAYNAYLRGQFHFQRGTEADTRLAIPQFAEAIRLDPDYALAHAAAADAWLAMAATFLTDADGIRQAYAQARAAITAALRLNPDLAAAHRSRVTLMIAVDYDWAGALAEAQRAAELEPGSASAQFSLANVEARLGQVQAAVERQQRALVRAPLDGFGYFLLARKLIGLGRLDEAEAALHKAISLAPAASRPHAYLALVKILQGDAPAALAAAKQEPAGFWNDFAVTLALQAGSDRAAADAALQNLIAKYTAGASYQIAEVYALRRDPDNVFKWLEQARVNRDAGMGLLLFDPLILRYQDDPRFTVFCKKVGLPATTDAVAMKL
jgi:TolB-like protein/Flp pilus assembly protein TadD